jgi:hypothetical protein
VVKSSSPEWDQQYADRASRPFRFFGSSYNTTKKSCFQGKIFHKQRANASATDYTNFTEPNLDFVKIRGIRGEYLVVA